MYDNHCRRTILSYVEASKVYIQNTNLGKLHPVHAEYKEIVEQMSKLTVFEKQFQDFFWRLIDYASQLFDDMFSILLSQLTPDYFYLIICVEKQKRRSAFIDSHRKPADIGVELGVASWQPPHPKNFRPTRNVCRPSRNLLT